ncbi:signal recognition particle GTPase [Bradyrhizobium sp. LM4.3]
MFDNLSERLGGILDRLTGRGALTEKDVDAAMREVRRALLEADVALEVVRSFTERVREQAIGATVVKSVTPGQMVVKIVHDELINMLGAESQNIDVNSVPPVPIMMVGLQGSGKTTTTAKLARRMVQRDKRKVLMASLDIYRPAAMEQLAVLGREPRHSDAADRRRPAAGSDREARAGGRQARRLRRRAARHRRPHHARRRDDGGSGSDQSRRQSA